MIDIIKTAVKITNPFWINVLTYLSEFSDKYAFSSLPEVEACSFLVNSNIKVGGEIARHKYS